jgi:hypothetical protein
MTLKWNGVIQRKLALLDQQVMRIEGHLRNVSREQFVQNWAMRTISERAIQVCVEIMIDVAERIIALAGAGPTATAVEAIEDGTVECFAECGVLPVHGPHAQPDRSWL